jgi:hypothetical protein
MGLVVTTLAINFSSVELPLSLLSSSSVFLEPLKEGAAGGADALLGFGASVAVGGADRDRTRERVVGADISELPELTFLEDT